MYSVNINGVWRSPSFSGDGGPLLDMLGGYPYLHQVLVITGSKVQLTLQHIHNMWISLKVLVQFGLTYLRTTIPGSLVQLGVMRGPKQRPFKASSKLITLLKGGVA